LNARMLNLAVHTVAARLFWT